MTRSEEVGSPLPDVACHVEKSVPVRGEGCDRRRPLVPMSGQSLPRELAVPGVRHHLSLGHELITPGEHGTVQPSSCRVLPFRLAGQFLPGPSCIRLGILERHLRHRVAIPAIQRRVRTFGVPPARAWDVGPPVRVVVEVDGSCGLVEHERAGDQEIGISFGIERRVEGTLGHRDVPGRLHESAELRHGDGPFVDPEPIQSHLCDGAFLRIEVLGAHPKLTGGYPTHVLGRRLGDRALIDLSHVAIHSRGEDLQPPGCEETRMDEVPTRSCAAYFDSGPSTLRPRSCISRTDLPWSLRPSRGRPSLC